MTLKLATRLRCNMWLPRSMMKLLRLILQLHGFCELFQMKKCSLKLHALCGTILHAVYYPMTKQPPSTSLSFLTASSYHWKTYHRSLGFQISSKLLSTMLLHRHLRLPFACCISHPLTSGTSSESRCTLIFDHPLSCPVKWFKHTLPAIYFLTEIAMLYCSIHHVNLKIVSILASPLFIQLNFVAYTIAQVWTVFKPCLTPSMTQDLCFCFLLMPLLYVQYFKVCQSPDKDPSTRMWMVERCLVETEREAIRLGEVIPLTHISHAAELVAVYGEKADCTISLYMSQECYPHFYLNHYADKEVYNVLHGWWRLLLLSWPGFVVARICTLHVIDLLLMSLLIKINHIIIIYMQSLQTLQSLMLAQLVPQGSPNSIELVLAGHPTGRCRSSTAGLVNVVPVCGGERSWGWYWPVT